MATPVVLSSRVVNGVRVTSLAPSCKRARGARKIDLMKREEMGRPKETYRRGDTSMYASKAM